MSSPINKKAAREMILAAVQAARPGWHATRVSMPDWDAYLTSVVRTAIHNHVRHCSSVGVTVYPPVRITHAKTHDTSNA